MTHRSHVLAGYYWAKWIACDEGTEDFEIFEPRTHFEPVEVTMNHIAVNHPEHLRVFVLGFAGSQSLDNFEFGERIELQKGN